MMILLDLDGLTLSCEEKRLLTHPFVKGVLLFSRNYTSIKQLKNLTAEIRQYLPNAMIAVDQEGGRVQRFLKEFTPLPSMRYWGKFYEINPVLATAALTQTIEIMAQELRAVGVNYCFAPILDIDYGVSEVINDRSFHRNPQIIITLARIVIQTLKKYGIGTTGKHFPGHGAVALDSHFELPIDPRSFDEIEQEDLRPFAALTTECDAMMLAHVVFPAVDALPATFSSKWLQDILRQRLNYKGSIISDDLSMKAAIAMGSYAERAKKAVAAGCDLLLICNNRQGTLEVLNALGEN